MDGIKGVAFDTGGRSSTGIRGSSVARRRPAVQRGVEHDWPALANEYRRRSFAAMLGASGRTLTSMCASPVCSTNFSGGPVSPPFRAMIDRRSRQAGTSSMLADFVPALASLRPRYVCVSLTILTLTLVIDSRVATDCLGCSNPL